MPGLSRGSIQNSLLSSLRSAALSRLLPHLERIALPKQKALAHPGTRLTHAYFPEAGMISVIVPLESGAIEVGTIGREGMLGVNHLLGGDIAFNRAIVQIAGSALRLPGPTLRDALKTDERLREHLGRYGESFYFQVSQTAACNGGHSLSQRCARWLLLARHRLGSDELPLTQELLSMMLAVRRAGVNEVALSLQKAGIIRYDRGHITIVDPASLEAVACECSRLIQEQEARLLT
jgi:CRP-like cAMP-binding protein